MGWLRWNHEYIYSSGWSRSSTERPGWCQTSDLKGRRKWTWTSPRPPSILCFLPLHHPSCTSHFPLASDLHVYKMEWFLSPSGEISCPRLSYMQDIRMTGRLDSHTLLLLLPSELNKKELCCKMFCGGCYYDFGAVCREYWAHGNGGWFFCRDLFDHLTKLLPLTLPLSSPEGSVHSNDSLSDSSPPAPGVPTQVVQPVQTTQQVRCIQTAWIWFLTMFEQVTTKFLNTHLYLSLWLHSSAEVSVASGVTGCQEDSDWPH